MLPILVPDDFRIIAHRGASAYAPENTLRAFDLSLKMGVGEVEVDTQLSADGHVVLCHDSTLDRYGHGAREVESLSWHELSDLDMGSWFSPFLYSDARFMSLPQLFEQYQTQFVYHIELKGKAQSLPEAVHACIFEHGLQSFCIVTSFSYAALVAMRAIDADIRLGWLVRTMDQATLAKAAELRLFQLCPLAETVTAEAVEQACQVVREVRAWGLAGKTTRNQSAEVISLVHNVLDSGCDGMTINWPDWVQHENA